MHFLLFYEKAPDYQTRQEPLTPAHRAYLEAAVLRGELVLGGSLGDPVDGSAVLLIQADSRTVAESLAAADPYVVGGIVCKWWVRAWDTVLGEGAAHPQQARS